MQANGPSPDSPRVPDQGSSMPPPGGWINMVPPTKVHGELSQSFAAVLTAFIIILLVDTLSLVFLFLFGSDAAGTFGVGPQVISIAIDIYLGINLLRGKNWARVWMIVRSVAGIVIFGIMYIIQGDIPDLVLNTGVLLAIILLITGRSSSLRTAGSGVLCGAAVIGTFTWLFMLPGVNLTTVPEKEIPASYETFSGHGFFSVAYPPDWETDEAALPDLQQYFQDYASEEGLEAEFEKAQIVFSCWKYEDDLPEAFVVVSLEPKPGWPLHTVVESTHNWSKENIEEYIEYSRVKTTVGSRETIIVTYQGRDTLDTLNKYTLGYIYGDKFLWSVVCGCDISYYPLYSDDFENIVRSLRVEW
jgi:hypothetical protein